MRSELEFRVLTPGELRDPAATPVGEAAASGFAQNLSQAVEALDKLQLDADHQADEVANGGGNLHEMAIALEKADLSMRLAVKVRNKVLETYNEIMRMGV